MPLPTLIVGAGPAGLAAAAELARTRLPYRLVERGDALGATWTKLYDSLTLHTGKHMSTLPGLPFPRSTPIFPTRDQFLDYLQRYQRLKALTVETGVDVAQIERENGGWRAATRTGEVIQASHIVMATGIVANPRVPEFAGRTAFRGRVLHSIEYRRPEGFADKRVLVVGVGNSGGEIGSELARHGARVTVAVRSGAHVVPKTIGPFPAQYVRYVVGKLPRGAQEFVIARVQQRLARKFGPPALPRPPWHVLDEIPLIGFALTDAIREGLIAVKASAITSFTEAGVRFADGAEAPFDIVILATGFNAAIQPLGSLVRTDAKGFAIRRDRVASADHAGLYFIGHNYDHTGGLTNIRRDAPLIARVIASQLR